MNSKHETPARIAPPDDPTRAFPMDRIAKRPERALTDPLAEPVGVAGLREIVPAVVVRENAAPEALADALASLSSHLLLQILLRAKDFCTLDGDSSAFG